MSDGSKCASGVAAELGGRLPDGVAGGVAGGRVMAVSQMLVSIVSLQFGSSLAEKLFPVYGAVGVASLRVCFAAILLGLIFRPYRGLSRAAIGAAVPYGVAMGLMNISFYLALERLPIGVTVAIEFIGPLLLTLWQSRGPRDLAWLALTVLGLTLLLRPHGDGTWLDPIGVLEASISSVFWVSYIIAGKRLTRLVPAQNAAALGLGVAAVLLAPGFVMALGSVGFNPSSLVVAVAVAALSSALPYTCECLAMRTLSARELGVLYSMEPVGAACAGLLFLGETLSFGKAAGIACVVAASIGVVLGGGDEEALEPPP